MFVAAYYLCCVIFTKLSKGGERSFIRGQQGKSDKISFGKLIQLHPIFDLRSLIAAAIIKWFIGQPK